MKLGVIYPQNELGGDPDAVRRIGLATETLGFDALVVYDHVVGATHDREPKLTGPYTEQHPFHDPFVMFGYLAALTRRIELVTGILILPQRQTALVARQAADVDLLSNQRLRLGLGIGWNYVEYEVLGQDFHTRGKRLEEQVALLRQLWTESLVSFDGRFDRLDRVALNPRPKRSIPLWLGGFADVALQRAAAIGDGFIFADGAADAHTQLATLKNFLAAAGRPIEGFGLQAHLLRDKSPEAFVDGAKRWRDAGGTHCCFHTMGQGLMGADAHLAHIERVAEALTQAGLLSA